MSEIVVKPLHGNGRQGGVQGRQRRRQPRLADRAVQHRLSRAARRPGLPPRASPRATSASSSSTARWPARSTAFPGEGEIRSNLAVGGKAAKTELTAREEEICAALGPELKKRGLLFVGIDVIGGEWLTEINVTSPTGIVAIDTLQRHRHAGAHLGRDRSEARLELFDWAYDWVIRLIDMGGYAGVFLLMLLETMFPPMPSEVILPVAGMRAADGALGLPGVIFAATAGAMTGNYLWYRIARAIGIERLRGFIIATAAGWRSTGADVEKVQRLFDRHGAGTSSPPGCCRRSAPSSRFPPAS